MPVVWTPLGVVMSICVKGVTLVLLSTSCYPISALFSRLLVIISRQYLMGRRILSSKMSHLNFVSDFLSKWSCPPAQIQTCRSSQKCVTLKGEAF